MTRILYCLVDDFSRLLEADERDAVCGDLAESGKTGGRALREVLGLVARRQAALWKDWRPWLTLVAVAAPLDMLLGLGSRMTANESATPIWMYANNWTWTYVTNAGARLDLVQNCVYIVKQCLILICWSWTCGFVLGSVSGRAIPLIGAWFCLVVLFAELLEAKPHLLPGWSHFTSIDAHDAVFSLTFYSLIFPLIVQVTLVLFPSVWGMFQGCRLVAYAPLLRTLLWTSVVITIVLLAMRNWGWILCSSGRFTACQAWASLSGYAEQAGHPQSRGIPTLSLRSSGPSDTYSQPPSSGAGAPKLRRCVNCILKEKPSMNPLRISTVLVALAGIAAAADPAGVSVPLFPENLRKPAAAFALQDAAGKTIKIEDYRGKVVLLDFWATWCTGCKKEIPWFSDFQKTYGDQGLAVVGVSMDEDGWKVLRPFLDEHKIPYEMVLGNPPMAKGYGIENLPDTFLIDKQGRVAAVYKEGLVDRNNVEANLKLLLAKQ